MSRAFGSVSMLVLVSSCGRLDFTAVAPVDASPTVYLDFSDAHAYVANDLVDTEIHDNEPVALCLLAPPFTSPLAVIAGRALIELPTDAAPVIHDYHPGVANASGPDRLVGCRSATTPSTGPVLWLAAASTNGGDGLYYVDERWMLVRDDNANNIGGMVIDDTGVLTGGEPDLLYVSNTRLYARPARLEVRDLGIRVNELTRAGDGSLAGAVYPTDFSRFSVARFEAETFSITELAPSGRFAHIAIDALPGPDRFVYAIVDQRDLVAVAADGTVEVLASATGADARWVSIVAAPESHELAGALYVLEVDRVADRDRVLRFAVD